MYYNDGDRQNSLSLIAVLITRLNTKASISYSLTRHRSHPEPRGAPLRRSGAGRRADKTHQLKLSSSLCVHSPPALLPACREDNTAGRPHAPGLCHQDTGDSELVPRPSWSFSGNEAAAPRNCTRGVPSPPGGTRLSHRLGCGRRGTQLGVSTWGAEVGARIQGKTPNFQHTNTPQPSRNNG